MRAASWVIVNKSTGKVVFETYNPNVEKVLNKAKYEAIPITKYLQSLNKSIKEGKTK